MAACTLASIAFTMAAHEHQNRTPGSGVTKIQKHNVAYFCVMLALIILEGNQINAPRIARKHQKQKNLNVDWEEHHSPSRE